MINLVTLLARAGEAEQTGGGGIDAATLAWSALISVVVATVVSAAFNAWLGGPLEARKQRYLERERVRLELERQCRVLLNGVRILTASNSSWGSYGGKLDPWPDDFEQSLKETLNSYREIRPHVSSMENHPPLAVLGRAVRAATSCIGRVDNFRKQGVGKDAEAFRVHHPDTRADLDEAQRVLRLAIDYLQASGVRQRSPRRKLAARLDELEELAKADKFPRTPINYDGALARIARDGE